MWKGEEYQRRRSAGRMGGIGGWMLVCVRGWWRVQGGRWRVKGGGCVAGERDGECCVVLL